MMRLDHVTYACGPDGLLQTAERISQSLGLEFVKGGVHPRFGTRNVIFPLKHDQFLEVVEVLNHPASDKAPFGQAVRARSELGGGWMGWCVSLEDLSAAEERLGRKAVPGNRKFPDGRELTWQQIGIKGLIADPQVPYLLRWDDGTEELHPSKALEPVGSISEISIAGSQERVLEWLGQPENVNLGGVTTNYQAPNGNPGILSVTFETERGTVVL
ncbi:hypothetical protein AUR04nite_24060 [Glutamicibacter uratoxydans]|uniref:Glyoxalase-like domain-containing protein n=1 Tax=Glutamicibacter uratoxydans TaxID=43667 RepID=A0A4Y4DSJ7_GLUUR|nr:VOC family protein [Glutamicibacter uratoxydans]GED06874.1 hypothetical protein AUR04nite_24060 [Glutamicibacter uratoxydans]